jgi:hypothetical protein
MLPKNFRPKKNYDLLRVGRNNDGGYLVEKNSIKNSKTLISFGIGNDWSFESHFKSHNNIKIFAYDYSVNSFFWSRQSRDLQFLFNEFFSNKNENYFFATKISKTGLKYLENISLEIPDIFNSLEFNLYGGTKPIFFKIDIEGSEYRILDDLINYQKDIEGLVIEFHNVDLHLEKISKFLDNINLELCHIHANNFENLDKFGIPTTLELTFSKNPIKLNDDSVNFPNFLDQKNNPDYDEIFLKFKN